MRKIFLFLCCLFGFGCASDTLTPNQFATRFAETMRKENPGIQVAVVGDLSLKVTDVSGKDSSAYLDNAYKDYLAEPTAFPDIVQRYGSSFLERKDGFDRNRIVPIIKDRGWMAEVAQSIKKLHGATIEHVYEDYNEELVIVYAEDSPRNIRYLAPESLSELGIPRQELRALAVENLRNMIPELRLQEGPEVSMIAAGGDYEASLLLLDKLWTNGDIKVKGEIVVAIPARDVLLVTGSETPGGVQKLREVTRNARGEASHALTDTLFVYRKGRFVRFEQ